MSNKPQPNQQEEIKFMIQHYPDGSVKPQRVIKNPVSHEIPPGIYSLQADENRGLFLQPENSYKLTSRVYGKSPQHIDRILRSFELNDKNLGVLLLGEPGAGKTLMLKITASKVVEMQMPVVLINEPYAGEALVSFLNSITQPTLFIFDEFDKIYAERTMQGNMEMSRGQNTLLQILDGTSAGSKKLFMFSANEEQLISRYMKDRPSRVRYTIKFDRMDVSTVLEYVSANLNDKDEKHAHAFIHLALSDGNGRGQVDKTIGSRGMNFDMMVELVKEMNQFGDNLNEVSALIRYYGCETVASYCAEIYEDGKLLQTTIGQGVHEGSYMGADKCSIIVSVAFDVEDEGGMQREYKQIQLTEEDFVAFGSENDVLEFCKDGITYMLRYITEVKFQQHGQALGAAQQAELQKQQQQIARQGYFTPKEKEGEEQPPKPPVYRIAKVTSIRSVAGPAAAASLDPHGNSFPGSGSRTFATSAGYAFPGGPRFHR